MIRNRIASFVVSAPHHNPDTFEHLPDELGQQLQTDIAQLAGDYRAGKVLRRPSFHRPDDDFDRIVDDQAISLEEFRALINRWAAEIGKQISRKV